MLAASMEAGRDSFDTIAVLSGRSSRSPLQQSAKAKQDGGAIGRAMGGEGPSLGGSAVGGPSIDEEAPPLSQGDNLLVVLGKAMDDIKERKLREQGCDIAIHPSPSNLGLMHIIVPLMTASLPLLHVATRRNRLSSASASPDSRRKRLRWFRRRSNWSLLLLQSRQRSPPRGLL